MADNSKIRSMGFGNEAASKMRYSDRIRRAFEMAGFVVNGTEARDNAGTAATRAGMAPALLEHVTVYLQSVIDDRRGVLLELCGGDMDTARGLIEHMETKRKLETRLAEIIEMEASTK